MQPHRIDTSRIIGRADDIDRLSKCLERDRLISLVGPGGAGKTCLAVAVMTNVQGRFESGASFVNLAPAHDHHSVISALASELGIPARPGKPLHDDLLDSIQSERRLLVLDNCEHVVAQSAELVASLLQRCPGVVVLVTSRQLLDLHEEVRWHVGGLDLPDPADSDWYQRPLPSAVLFFENRLRHVDPGFELDDSNAPDVAAICCELDGMPLAMELAAASSIHHGLRDIADRVRHSVLQLRSTDRDQDERHRSLQVVVDWSLGLLSSSERQLFTKLSTFSGEFTLEAASEVAGAPDPSETEQAMGALVSKSLLERVVDGTHQRFRMLVPLRQSASELLPKGDREECRERHTSYYERCVGQLEEQLWDARQKAALDELDQIHDEVRSALRWSIDTAHADAACHLSGSMARFWDLRGHYVEGLAWTRSALDVEGDVPAASLALALNGFATLALLNGEIESSVDAARRAADVAEANSDDAGAAYALQYLGLAHVYAHLFADALEILGRSEAKALGSGDPRLLAWTRVFQGAAFLSSDDHAQALSHTEAAARLFDDLGDSEGLGWCSFARCIVEWERSDLRACASQGLRSVRHFAELQAAWGLSSVGILAGALLAAAGEYSAARLTIEQSENLRTEIGATHLPTWERYLDQTVAVLEQADHSVAHSSGRRRGIDLDRVVSDLEAVLERFAEPEILTLEPDDRARLRPGLEVWTISHQGINHHVRDVVGLGYLAVLIDRPGVPILAVELEMANQRTDPRSRHLEGLTARTDSNAGDLVDDQALRSYRARLSELREEIEDAEQMCDDERGARSRIEFDFIADELAAATGLGGRRRKAASTEERGRVRVTKAIRSAIKRVRDVDDQVGRHLDAAIKTGRFCSYEPDQAPPPRCLVARD